jgi:ribosomal protein L11
LDEGPLVINVALMCGAAKTVGITIPLLIMIAEKDKLRESLIKNAPICVTTSKLLKTEKAERQPQKRQIRYLRSMIFLKSDGRLRTILIY